MRSQRQFFGIYDQSERIKERFRDIRSANPRAAEILVIELQKIVREPAREQER